MTTPTEEEEVITAGRKVNNSTITFYDPATTVGYRHVFLYIGNCSE
jgi:hypothetical protein